MTVHLEALEALELAVELPASRLPGRRNGWYDTPAFGEGPCRHSWAPIVPPDDRPRCRRCDRPKTREADFREQLVGRRTGRDAHDGLADQLGWYHVGWRPAQTAHGWRTPGTGPLAAGWPDLVLMHPGSRRLLFVELKGDGGKLDPAQEVVLGLLELVAERSPLVEVHLWWPDDLELAGRVLIPGAAPA